MAILIQLRQDTAANFSTANPVLAQGEPALEIDSRKEKIGDGITAWNALPYRLSGGLDDANYDGGTPESIYLTSQTLDGGIIT